MRKRALWLPAIALALFAPAVHGGAPAGGAGTTAAAQRDVATIVDAMIGMPILSNAIRAHVESHVEGLKQRDPQIDRRLATDAALQVALVDRVTAHYQSEAFARLPAARALLGELLSREMTATQLAATARMFASDTGKRLVEHILKSLMTASSEEDVEEMSDAEAGALIDAKDTPAMLAFTQSGADKKFEKIGDILENQHDDMFEYLMDDMDTIIVDILNMAGNTKYPA